MGLHETVINFINHFTDRGNRPQVIDTFTNGYCYWFAEILYCGFLLNKNTKECKIVYDPLINHFACQINGKIYDIRGDITMDLKYSWEDWSEYELLNELETARIYRDCIYFGGNENG